MAEEFRVYVGCVEAQWLPFAVLRHSIVRHTTRQFSVHPLYESGIEIPVPRDEKNRQKTLFSFQRFTIPEACGYRGKAIYLDSDMLVFHDMAPLFDQEFGTANILAVPNETSVLVLDCERLAWSVRDLVANLDAGKMSYDALMKCRSIASVSYCLPSRWNWLDNSTGKMPANVALLHYTVTTSQPWLASGHPLGHLWLGELFCALDDGAILTSEIENAVGQGYVRPSLLYQSEHRVTKLEELPSEVLKGDGPFADYCRSVRYNLVGGFRR